MQSAFKYKMKEENKITVEYAGALSIREKLVLLILEKGAPLHYHFCSRRKPWGLNSVQLLQFPDGSLGHELGLFYKSQGFEPIPKAERHDVFHVLLGYTTEVPDEAAMQFFLWGNGKASLFTVGTALVSATLFPFQWKRYISEFKKGKACSNISNWDFKALLSENTNALKSKIFKQNTI